MGPLRSDSMSTAKRNSRPERLLVLLVLSSVLDRQTGPVRVLGRCLYCGFSEGKQTNERDFPPPKK
jgi:hypothetical protein